jgi:hypothetical protein
MLQHFISKRPLFGIHFLEILPKTGDLRESRYGKIIVFFSRLAIKSKILGVWESQMGPKVHGGPNNFFLAHTFSRKIIRVWLQFNLWNR